MRKCITNYCKAKGDDTWMILSDKLIGNVGIIFTKGDLLETRKKIQQFVVLQGKAAIKAVYRLVKSSSRGSDRYGTVPNVLLPNAQHCDED